MKKTPKSVSKKKPRASRGEKPKAEMGWCPWSPGVGLWVTYTHRKRSDVVAEIAEQPTTEEFLQWKRGLVVIPVRIVPLPPKRKASK